MCHKFFVLVALVATCVSVRIIAEDQSEPSAVHVLHDSNFDSTLEADDDVVFVKFYDPRCVHCKKLAPEWVNAANHLKEKGVKVKLADVDATANQSLADRYDIRAYPTLKLFRNKTEHNFSGGRTAEELIQYVMLMVGPALTEHKGTLDDLIKDVNPKATFYGEFSSTDSELYKEYENFAEENRGSARFMARVLTGVQDKIHVIHEGETPIEKSSDETFSDFYKDKLFRLLGPINAENFQAYNARNLHFAWFCGDKSHYDEYSAAIRSVAAKQKEHAFVWLDTDQYKGHAEMSLGVTTFPALVVVNKQQRFVLPDPPTALKSADSIQFFMEELKAGRVERSLRSEDIPEKNDGAVKVVVGKNFEDIVLAEANNVLLKVYAPWCGHCQTMAPDYEKAAKELSDTFENVVLAKMDGTQNESPRDEFHWNGFPTLYFVPKGQKEPQPYTGARKHADIVSWVKEHAVDLKEKTAGPEHTDEL